MDDEIQEQPKVPYWSCRNCGFEGYPQPAIAPRPSDRKVFICPACLEQA